MDTNPANATTILLNDVGSWRIAALRNQIRQMMPSLYTKPFGANSEKVYFIETNPTNGTTQSTKTVWSSF